MKGDDYDMNGNNNMNENNIDMDDKNNIDDESNNVPSITSIYTDSIHKNNDSENSTRLIEKFIKRNFLDFFSSKWRIMHFIILIVFIILLFIPMFNKSLNELAYLTQIYILLFRVLLF